MALPCSGTPQTRFDFPVSSSGRLRYPLDTDPFLATFLVLPVDLALPQLALSLLGSPSGS